MTIVNPIISYRNKKILAPMVRVNTLPMRLLALEYGADFVYSEELVDLKMIKTQRRVNSVLGTVDFVDPSDGSIIFRTCDIEKGKVVLQLGTSSPERALTVAKLIENDVAAIDINMGCPKEFSIKGGMGAALLSNQEKAKAILKTLIDNLKIPVTCKIRILKTPEETINLVKEFANIGVKAVGIHARFRDERPRHEPHPDYVKKVADSVEIPIIANGGSKDIQKYDDINKFKILCGTDSIMIARAAQYNASIFRKDGLLPIDDVITRYLQLCVDYDNAPSNTKYCVQNMIKDQQETPRGKKFLNCQTLQQICEIWNLGSYCYNKQVLYQKLGMYSRRDVTPGQLHETENHIVEPPKKKQKSNIFERNIAFFRSNYNVDSELPKSMLHLYALKNNIALPKYATEQKDKLFQTTLTFDKKTYGSSYWEKNKKYAEQGAALVCCLFLNLVNEETLIKNGSILA